MSDKFVTAKNGSMVNLRHVVMVTSCDVAILSQGREVELIYGWKDEAKEVSPVIPAAPGTEAVVAIAHDSDGGVTAGLKTIPVVAWQFDPEFGASPIFPEQADPMNLGTNHAVIGLKQGDMVLWYGTTVTPKKLADVARDNELGRQEFGRNMAAGKFRVVEMPQK